MAWLGRFRWGGQRVASLAGGLALLAMALVMIPGCGEEFADENPRCEGDSSLPCNEDPWVCPEGQNCWSDNQGVFSCYNAGAAGPGESCLPYSGTSTCVADHGCVALNGAMTGTCQAYCDLQDPCKACEVGFNCTPLTFNNGSQISFCLPG